MNKNMEIVHKHVNVRIFFPLAFHLAIKACRLFDVSANLTYSPRAKLKIRLSLSLKPSSSKASLKTWLRRFFFSHGRSTRPQTSDKRHLLESAVRLQELL